MTIEEIRAEALDNARNGQSVANYAAIFSGFTAKGIAESDILPRENVLTFQAWKALGRSVRKGEHGVKVCTFVPIKDKDTGEVVGRSPHTTTVFHISQTEDTAAAEKRWAEKRVAKPESKPNPSYPYRRDPVTGLTSAMPKPDPAPSSDRWIDA